MPGAGGPAVCGEDGTLTPPPFIVERHHASVAASVLTMIGTLYPPSIHESVVSEGGPEQCVRQGSRSRSPRYSGKTTVRLVPAVRVPAVRLVPAVAFCKECNRSEADMSSRFCKYCGVGLTLPVLQRRKSSLRMPQGSAGGSGRSGDKDGSEVSSDDDSSVQPKDRASGRVQEGGRRRRDRTRSPNVGDSEESGDDDEDVVEDEEVDEEGVEEGDEDTDEDGEEENEEKGGDGDDEDKEGGISVVSSSESGSCSESEEEEESDGEVSSRLVPASFNDYLWQGHEIWPYDYSAMMHCNDAWWRYRMACGLGVDPSCNMAKAGEHNEVDVDEI